MGITGGEAEQIEEDNLKLPTEPAKPARGHITHNSACGFTFNILFHGLLK